MTGQIVHEFINQQLILIVGLLLCGFIAAYLQYGYIPGSGRPFPLAGVRVAVWHLLWMGAWTGYTMALVGQAAGIFALPYSTSVLQFSNPHVTPTMLVLTLFNPIGALLGYRRSGQWNLDLAAAVCAGGVIGGVIGPFLRATVLANGNAFKDTLGIALALFGIQLCYRAVSDYRRFGSLLGSRFVKGNDNKANGGRPTHFMVTTVSRDWGHITIRFGDEERRFSNLALCVAGLAVGVFSSALGIGGGFLLVPIFAIGWGLPIYVMVAATIPYTLALSLAGLFTFNIILPLAGTPAIAPEWSWGLFCAAGGVFGSWVASKTQIYVPEHFLGFMLGAVTGVVGCLYVLSAMISLPFKL